MILITEALKSQLSSISELIDTCFGENYSSTKSLFSPDSFSFVAHYNGKTIGFVNGKIMLSKALEKTISSPLKLDQSIIGVLDLIVVHPDYQRQGIGKSLFEKRLIEFKNRGISDLFLFHWIRKNQVVPFIAKDFGFQELEVIPNYWKSESLTKNYTCPECDNSPPCNCSCGVYLKKIL